MTILRIVLIIDDSNPAQATLLGQIQSTLGPIATNTVPAAVPPQFRNSIEVQKLG